MLMTTALSLACLTRCAWRCTCPRNPCMCPHILTLCICVFASGKPMTCIHGWMPATPPSAMQSIPVGLAALSHLRKHAPPFSQVTSAICLVLLDIPPPTELVAYIHDASWYPGHCQSGGAVAVLNLLTGVTNSTLCIYPSFATTLTKRRSMWPGLFSSPASPVHPRGGAPFGLSPIRSLTSVRRKVGMTAIALSSLPYFNAAEACLASGKSHAICTLISKEPSWMKC